MEVLDWVRESMEFISTTNTILYSGLSMSKDLAEIMNGEVVVESKEGVGSKFTLSFPTSAFPTQGPSHADLGEGLEGKCRIVYIHSRAICREIVSEQLRFCSFKFEVASSVAEAWELYRHNNAGFAGVTLIMADVACVAKDDSFCDIPLPASWGARESSHVAQGGDDSTALCNIIKLLHIFFSSTTYFILFSNPSFTTALHVTVEDYIREQLTCLVSTPVLPTQLIDSILDNVERFSQRQHPQSPTQCESRSLVDSLIAKHDSFVESPCDLSSVTQGISTGSTITSTTTDQSSNSLGISEKLHILLAEDNLVNQKVARLHLEKLGCTVETANNGQEAIDFYCTQSSRYSCIFMDLQVTHPL
jgi:CheY-like chemotaxis protein